MLLYLVRHGDPDYKTDSLTERGKLQAEAVGKRIIASKIDRIFSSPMGRAKMTAEPACRLLGIEYEVEEWTKEVEEYIKTTYPDGKIKSIDGLQNTAHREGGCIDLSYENAFECPTIGESGMGAAVKYVEENGNAFLERLGYREKGGNYRILRENEERVALFCHGGFMRTWLSVLLHIPLHMMLADFDINHTGVTVIQFKNNENGITAPRLLCYSDLSHLYAEGLDMRYNGGIEI